MSKTEFCHIAPTPHLDLTDGRSVHLVLAHLIETDDNYVNFYLEQKEKYGCTIIMDNSAFEMFKQDKPMYPAYKLITMAEKIKTDYIVMSDYPGERAEKTIEAAKELTRASSAQVVIPSQSQLIEPTPAPATTIFSTTGEALATAVPTEVCISAAPALEYPSSCTQHQQWNSANRGSETPEEDVEGSLVTIAVKQAKATTTWGALFRQVPDTVCGRDGLPTHVRQPSRLTDDKLQLLVHWMMGR